MENGSDKLNIQGLSSNQINFTFFSFVPERKFIRKHTGKFLNEIKVLPYW